MASAAGLRRFPMFLVSLWRTFTFAFAASFFASLRFFMRAFYFLLVVFSSPSFGALVRGSKPSTTRGFNASSV